MNDDIKNKNEKIDSPENDRKDHDNNLFQTINKKLVFIMPKNYSGLKISGISLKLILNYPEPYHNQSNEEKFKYHRKENKNIFNYLKKELKGLKGHWISSIDREIVIIFDSKYYNENLNIVTSNKFVVSVISYTGKEKEEDIFIPDFLDTDYQYDTAKGIELMNKKMSNPKLKLKNLEVTFLSLLNVLDSEFDEKTKTLSLKINGLKDRNVVNQFLAYIYKKGNHFSIFKERLVSIIQRWFSIKNIKYNTVKRIIFVMNGNQNVLREISIGGFIWEQDTQTDIFPEDYLNSDDYFINKDSIEIGLNHALEFNKNLFEALTSNKFVSKEISLINPNDLEVLEIENTGDGKLFVKFNIFDTQEKMNLLFAYLVLDPYNKDVWIKNICQKIFNKVNEKNSKEIEKYNFISFDENSHPHFRDIYKASIGGTELEPGVFSLEECYVNKYVLFDSFEDFGKFPHFEKVDDLIAQLNINLELNFETYIAYNSASTFIYDYNIQNILENAQNVQNLNLWDYFNDKKLDSLDIKDQKYIPENNQVRVTFNNIKNQEEMNLLFSLFYRYPKDSMDWKKKIIFLVKKAIILCKRTFEDIKYIGFNFNDLNVNIKIASLGGFESRTVQSDEPDPKTILTDNGFFNGDPDSFMRALEYNISVNADTWEKYICEAIPMQRNSLYGRNHPFDRQFTAVGLSKYFSLLNAGNFPKDKEDMKIGICETSAGIVDYQNRIMYDAKNIVDTRNCNVRNHADLVGFIIGSSLIGIDRSSTLISSGFYYNINRQIWGIDQVLDWIISKGSTLINCSWGSTKTNALEPDYAKYSEVAFKLDYYSRKYNVTFIKSAGNSRGYGFNPYFRYERLAMNIVVVGSCSDNGNLISRFTDYKKYPNNRVESEAPKPLLLAPGENYKYYNQNLSGTSFAAPVVTGVVSLLMKEYSKLRRNPAGVLAVLTACSLQGYVGFLADDYRLNNLRNISGAGLLSYAFGRHGASNLLSTSIDNDTQVNTVVLESRCFQLEKNWTLTVASAVLFNGGFVNYLDRPDVLDTDHGIATVPIIGHLYKAAATIINNRNDREYDSKFQDKPHMLKMGIAYNADNPDDSLLPPTLKIILKKFDLATGQWHIVSWVSESVSDYSNVGRYEYRNPISSGSYKYQVIVTRQGKHLDGDHTPYRIAATHCVR